MGEKSTMMLLQAGRCGKADYIRIYRVNMEPTALVRLAKGNKLLD
jgi:hypothetical protein